MKPEEDAPSKAKNNNNHLLNIDQLSNSITTVPPTQHNYKNNQDYKSKLRAPTELPKGFSGKKYPKKLTTISSLGSSNPS